MGIELYGLEQKDLRIACGTALREEQDRVAVLTSAQYSVLCLACSDVPFAPYFARTCRRRTPVVRRRASKRATAQR